MAREYRCWGSCSPTSKQGRRCRAIYSTSVRVRVRPQSRGAGLQKRPQCPHNTELLLQDTSGDTKEMPKSDLSPYFSDEETRAPKGDDLPEEKVTLPWLLTPHPALFQGPVSKAALVLWGTQLRSFTNLALSVPVRLQQLSP